ncbi:Vinorine synthase [Bienertia sinuspersici]
MNIKVISDEVIKPSIATPKHLHTLSASLLDHLNLPILFPGIFFYSQNNATNISTNKMLDQLKESLSKTLTVFYPLSGRIEDTNHFNCNDKGVPYVRAMVDKRLEEVVHKVDVSELDKLLPSYGQERSTTNLLLTIQVNTFACGGIAIGLKMSHAISDAFSMVMFVNAWASMTNNNGKNHKKLPIYPNFGISKHFPLHDILYSKANVQNTCNPINNRPIAKWFLFEEGKIHILRSKLSSYTNTCTSNKDGDGTEISVPSFAMVLAAFVWCRIKVACYNSAIEIPNIVIQAVNIRSRLSLPDEQSYYFGNVFVNTVAKLSNVVPNDENYLNETLMSDFLKQTKESIARINEEDGFVRRLQEGKIEDLRSIKEHFERESKGEIVLLAFSNVRNLPMYEADFGWGKPVWVTSATRMFKNMVQLMPASSTSKDIVVYINLSHENMEKLLADSDFNSLVSKLPHVKTVTNSRL